VEFYKASLCGLALAFVAWDADAASVRSVRTVQPPANRSPVAAARAASGGPSVVRAGTVQARAGQTTAAISAPVQARRSTVYNHVRGNAAGGITVGGGAGGGEVTIRDIDDLERRKADRDEVYTRRETDHAIASAIADAEFAAGNIGKDVLTIHDIGTNPGNVVAVGPDGRIDPRLYDSGGGVDIPTPPADGNRYVLLATSAGTKEWIRVRDTFVKNW